MSNCVGGWLTSKPSAYSEQEGFDNGKEQDKDFANNYDYGTGSASTMPGLLSFCRLIR